MYFLRGKYNIYDWSNRATFLSILGGIIRAFCWLCAFGIITLLISIPTATNPDYTSDIKVIIPILIILWIIFFIIGGLLRKKAEKIAYIDFENKVENDFQFAKMMAKKDLENKKWYMERNSQYAEYVESGREELEADDKQEKVKKSKYFKNVGEHEKKKLLLYYSLLLIILLVGLYFTGDLKW